MVDLKLEAYLVKILPLDMMGLILRLEEADDTARLGVESDLPESWPSAKTRHRLHIAKDGVEEASASRQADGADGDGESSWDTLEFRIMRERVLRLRHADWSDGQTRCQ